MSAKATNWYWTNQKVAVQNPGRATAKMLLAHKAKIGEAWHQQPQNISDNGDVYNHDFTGIWENDALDYLPDTSQIAEVLELAFN